MLGSIICLSGSWNTGQRCPPLRTFSEGRWKQSTGRHWGKKLHALWRPPQKLIKLPCSRTFTELVPRCPAPSQKLVSGMEFAASSLLGLSSTALTRGHFFSRDATVTHRAPLLTPGFSSTWNIPGSCAGAVTQVHGEVCDEKNLCLSLNLFCTKSKCMSNSVFPGCVTERQRQTLATGYSAGV